MAFTVLLLSLARQKPTLSNSETKERSSSSLSFRVVIKTEVAVKKLKGLLVFFLHEKFDEVLVKGGGK